MTVVFLNFSNGEKTQSWQHLPRFHVTWRLRPSYGAFLSYGFPTKLRAGPSGSYDKGMINRDFKIQRRGRQREGKKKNRFDKQNNNFARASHFFCTILSRFYTTTTWKCLISRFMEDVNKERRNFISLSELGYGHLKFSFRRVRPHLTK